MNTEEIKFIYANAPVDRTQFEVITFDADWFSQPYYLQNVFAEDIQVTLETLAVVDVLYAPMALEQASSTADLSYERTITIEMLNDIIATENDNYDPDVYSNQPTFTSRGYIMYRDGTISDIQFGPITLPVNSISSNGTGATIAVSTKSGNDSPTGEVCTVARAQGLRGYE